MFFRYGNASKQSSYRSDRPISNDEIARYAPSVLAEAPHASRGERYTFIPTVRVLDGLRSNGFEVFEVRQTKVRDESRREHTKHLLRLRHPEMLLAGTNEEVPELVLLNSHDGTSAYQLLAGVFRMVCSNGLISGSLINDIRVRHSGRIVDDVIEGSFEVIDTVNSVGQSIERFKSIQLSAVEQEQFGAEALKLRWDGQAPVSSSSVVRPRRWEDRNNSLWETFNRAQENLIVGGLRGRAQTGRRLTTRGVNSVNESVKLNRALWSLADEWAIAKNMGVAA